MLERMLGAELTELLGKKLHGEPASQQSGSDVNGSLRKVTDQFSTDGAVPIDIPRDWDWKFSSRSNEYRKARPGSPGCDDKIIGLYAAGLSTRDIRANLDRRLWLCACLPI